jgi:di/tricarboxylate transporter
VSPEATGCAALLLAVAAGCATRIPLAVLAPALALPLGVWGGLGGAGLLDAFPWMLTLRLVLITGVFALCQANGTLERLAWVAVRATGARPGLVGPLFFCAGLGLASSGSGNFAAASMLTPVAMTVARRTGVSAFLMSVMVVYGATAGAFSPIAPTGLVADTLLTRAAVPHSAWTLFATSLAAHALVAAAVYLGGRGWRHGVMAGPAEPPASWSPIHRRSVWVLAAFVTATLAARIPVEWAAGAAAALLIVVGGAPGAGWARLLPWRLIGLVCGVSFLAGVVQRTGGMTLLGQVLAATGDARWLPGVLAFVSGVVSVTASSIGVVLPAFLPAVQEIARAADGGNPSAIAYAINVGAHLVDISPLSPLGAMCVAFAAMPAPERNALYRQLMMMGLGMCFAGAALCQALFGSPILAWLEAYLSNC